jgi:large subunit ribosomal protein L46
LTEFEAAYFQHRQNQASASTPPFPIEFYFKKGSETERIWQRRERGELSDEEWKQMREQVDGKRIELADRETSLDKATDRQSLERQLKDTLYLVVKRNRNKYQWQFPQGAVESEELLHQVWPTSNYLTIFLTDF